MDSKLMAKALLIVTLFIGTVFVVILGVNGVFEPKKSQPVVQVTEPQEEEELIFTDMSAWMQDETFFDAEKLGDGKYEIKNMTDVSIMASSIDKDLRIMVLDPDGKIVKNRRFTVTIDEEEYSDDDRDGIMYISDVSPGEHQISLNPLMGMNVPQNAITVTVSAKIEYKALDDISYLILTEADIDPAKEDTAVNDAEEESVGNTAIKTVEGASFGIDVSKWNGDIDWERVKEEGVKFAIIRCGYRGSQSGSIIEDPYFKANIEGATNAGIPVGIYFFTQAMNSIEAVEEASACMSLIKDYKIKYPVFIDTESAGGNGRADKLEVKDRSMAIQAFCETIRSGGYTAGVYASKNWFNNRLDISKLSADNVMWLAQYADKPDWGATYQLWQYSSAGRINGIEGRVDMNLSYLDVGDEKEKGQVEDGQDNSRDM